MKYKGNPEKANKQNMKSTKKLSANFSWSNTKPQLNREISRKMKADPVGIWALVINCPLLLANFLPYWCSVLLKSTVSSGTRIKVATKSILPYILYPHSQRRMAEDQPRLKSSQKNRLALRSLLQNLGLSIKSLFCFFSWVIYLIKSRSRCCMRYRRMIAFLYHFSKAIITLLLGAHLLLSSDIALAKAAFGSIKATYAVSIKRTPYYPKSISKEQELIKGVIDPGNNNYNKLGRRLC